MSLTVADNMFIHSIGLHTEKIRKEWDDTMPDEAKKNIFTQACWNHSKITEMYSQYPDYPEVDQWLEVTYNTVVESRRILKEQETL